MSSGDETPPPVSGSDSSPPLPPVSEFDSPPPPPPVSGSDSPLPLPPVSELYSPPPPPPVSEFASPPSPPPGQVNGSLHPGPTGSPPAPFAIGGPSKSTQVPLIAGLSVAVGVLVVVFVCMLVWCANKRKKTNPSAKSDGGAISGSHGLFSPFPCCPIVIQMPQSTPQLIVQQQPSSMPRNINAAEDQKPSLSPHHQDEVLGAQAQDFSPSPNPARPFLLDVVPPTPTHHPTNKNYLSSHTGLSIQSVCKAFTYMELDIATNSFREENFLGKGGFGCVHKGVLPDLKEIAVKQLNLESKQGNREFQAEVETIGRVHHRNLVSLVGYCIHENNRLLVYEFIPNKTLDFHLHGEGQPTMEWSKRVKIAVCSAKGIAYLHEDCLPKIIHRDIKASNILLDFNFEAKVADFGLAKFSPDDKTHVSTRVMGTFGYLAPEYANSGYITEKSDIYSFGAILVELITGRSPSTPIKNGLVSWVRPLMLQSLRDGKFDIFVDPKLKHNYNNKEMKRMITCAIACTELDSKSRPKMTQVVQVLEGVMSMDFMYCERSNATNYDKNASSKTTTSSSQEHTSTEYSSTSSEYALNLSSSPAGGR